ncbi:GNAT family N-acetyltransferase [Paenibacillus filicis]|uniref:GNAT family N-acetyltransferase n=1 Tax=Paenibacillus filicis TaxID=669464 RepID=A0ABU9DIV0_9BACL
MTQEIRAITEDVLNACTDLYIEVFNQEPWNDSWTEDTALKRLRHISLTPGFVGFSLYEKGELAGFVAGYREQWFDSEHFDLVEFCIRTGRQGNGYGSALLHHLEQHLSHIGVSRIYLLTMRAGQAEAFYKKNNYDVNGHMVMMGKKLGAGKS